MAETPPASGTTPIPTPGSGLERQTLEALKAIGKALGQMALYKVGHPAVVATITTAQENLTAALALAPTSELVVGLDRDKLIFNGRVAGSLAQLPVSLANLFNRFKLTSLTFRSGLTTDELVAFCELAAMRVDAPAAADPKGFLAGRGASHIVFNEAVYLKAGENGAGADGQASAAAAAPAISEAERAQAEIKGINDAIAGGSLERTMIALVEKSVPDPELRKKVIEQVMKLLERDIEKRVDEVTTPLKRDKKTLQNEQARTDSVLSNMVEGVVVVDEQGKILMMNPAAEQIYGSSLVQTAGKDIIDKASEQFVVTLAAELRAPADRDVDVAVKTRGAAETQRTLRASTAVVKTEEGKVVGMVSSLPDATKHRELQKMQRDFVA
ncbi:MAG: PAS domain S-box protein, partial [Elusimicrobia bacterium]|nr:PAS domain S-box protein [Elusimicrobiota bacterium]